MLDLNINPKINIPDFRKKATVEIKGDGNDWASETEGETRMVSKNGKTAMHVEGAKAWHHKGTLTIIAE